MARKLRAPAGTDEVNFGTERYKVGTDGTVEVPDDAADTLIGVAGLSVINDAPVEIPDGHVALRSIVGPLTLAVGGNSYSTDENDRMVIPLADLCDDVTSHGLVLAEVIAEMAPDAPVEPPASQTEPVVDPPVDPTEPPPQN